MCLQDKQIAIFLFLSPAPQVSGYQTLECKPQELLMADINTACDQTRLTFIKQPIQIVFLLCLDGQVKQPVAIGT